MIYYNENDPFAAAWLRELMRAGAIAEGEIDERSIEDVVPNDIKGFRQCHFFAGIGVWSYALKQAGWPDDREIWTGSCPCQPFSAAGKRAGTADERHLWPAFDHLIEVRQPGVVVGEQVASKDGLAWLDLVSSDMEAKGYAFAAIDLCAAGLGAPHTRQRLYWMADADPAGFSRNDDPGRLAFRDEGNVVERDGTLGRMANANGGNARTERQQRSGQHGQQPQDGMAGRMADADQQGSGWRGIQRPEEGTGAGAGTALERSTGFREDCGTGPTNGFWGAADWLGCRDGKWRPVEPGTFPLVDVAANRVGRLRGYGNALVAAQAIEFIRALL